MKTFATVGLALLLVCLFAIGALAQVSNATSAANDTQSARIAKLEQAVAEAKDIIGSRPDNEK